MHVVATLLTTEDAALLVRGVETKLFSGPARSAFDPLALPLNDFQCVHVEIAYIPKEKIAYTHKENAPKGVTVAAYDRCNNSINTDGAYLCPYHDRVLLTPRLSASDLAAINAKLGETYADDIADGVIKADKRELARYPVKRVNGLRIHLSPYAPTLKDATGNDRVIVVNPDWEKVSLNG